MADDEPLGIGDLAERIGVTPRALRHYEQQQLISPGRMENGYRFYDRTLAVRAANIKKLFDLGLSADDIRPQVDEGCLDTPIEQRPACHAELAPIHARLDTLDELIARLEQSRDRLRKHADSIVASLGQPH